MAARKRSRGGSTSKAVKRQGAPMVPEDLKKLDTVSMSAADGRSAWDLVGPNGQEYVLHHRPRYVADDLQTLKLAVLAGSGISFLPETLSSFLMAYPDAPRIGKPFKCPRRNIRRTRQRQR